MISRIITIDQSTSATKAMLFSEDCELLHRVNIEHQQFYPQIGWVEHDAEEIYKNTIETIHCLLEQEEVNLIVSDIMMPEIDGFEFARNLREVNKHIPILFMSAKDDLPSKQKGFQLGIDDYMVKPVNVNEMVLRVGALLRRAQILNEHKIVIGSTEFDYDAMTVTTDKESLVLPKKEFLLLYKLAASPGRTFTKQQLMDEVWGYETEADPHTIEVHIGRIRERFKDNPDFEIVTMRGIGYKVVKK